MFNVLSSKTSGRKARATHIYGWLKTFCFKKKRKPFRVNGIQVKLITFGRLNGLFELFFWFFFLLWMEGMTSCLWAVFIIIRYSVFGRKDFHGLNWDLRKSNFDNFFARKTDKEIFFHGNEMNNFVYGLDAVGWSFGSISKGVIDKGRPCLHGGGQSLHLDMEKPYKCLNGRKRDKNSEFRRIYFI